MSAKNQQRLKAFEVIAPDGRAVITFAFNNGTAHNRGSRQLGLEKHGAISCRRRPDLDTTAPATDPKMRIGKPIPAHVIEAEQANPGTRYCYACQKAKPVDNFHRGTTKKVRECKSCRRERWSALSPTGRAKQLVSMAKHRARAKVIPFDLLAEDITVPDVCPVLGIPLRFSTLAERHNSPSLDRLRPELGYVRGNVIVVSWLANDIRRNFRPEDLIAVGQFYAKSLAVSEAT
jgi:hypothetical protein